MFKEYYQQPIITQNNQQKLLFSGDNYYQICNFVGKGELEHNWLSPTFSQIKIDDNLVLNKGQYLIKENNEFRIEKEENKNE